MGAACLCSAHVADAQWRPIVPESARLDHVEYVAEAGHVSVGLLPSGPAVTARHLAFIDSPTPATGTLFNNFRGYRSLCESGAARGVITCFSYF